MTKLKKVPQRQLNFLEGLAQSSKTKQGRGFDYTDIMKYEGRAAEKDIRDINVLVDELFDYDEDEGPEWDEILNKIIDIVTGEIG